jgi:hypothetical protein
MPRVPTCHELSRFFHDILGSFSFIHSMLNRLEELSEDHKVRDLLSSTLNNFEPKSPEYVSHLQQFFFAACSVGYITTVEWCIHLGVDINSQCSDGGDNALALAARQNQFEMVSFLLARGVNVDHKNKLGATALHCASHFAVDSLHFDSVMRIVRAGAEISIKNNIGMSMLDCHPRSQPLKIAVRNALAARRLSLFDALMDVFTHRKPNNISKLNSSKSPNFMSSGDPDNDRYDQSDDHNFNFNNSHNPTNPTKSLLDTCVGLIVQLSQDACDASSCLPTDKFVQLLHAHRASVLVFKLPEPPAPRPAPVLPVTFGTVSLRSDHTSSTSPLTHAPVECLSTRKQLWPRYSGYSRDEDDDDASDIEDRGERMHAGDFPAETASGASRTNISAACNIDHNFPSQSGGAAAAPEAEGGVAYSTFYSSTATVMKREIVETAGNFGRAERSKYSGTDSSEDNDEGSTSLSSAGSSDSEVSKH